MSRARTRRIKQAMAFTGPSLNTWNGLIMLGKDRNPRLLKALKPMQPVYVYCRYDWPAQDEWRYGCGFYTGADMVYFKDVVSGSEYLVSKSEIESFSVYKFVGNKNVYFDATDDELQARADEVRKRLEQMSREEIAAVDHTEIRHQGKSIQDILEGA